MQNPKPFDAAVKTAVHSAAIDRANKEPAPGALGAVYVNNPSIEIRDEQGRLKFSVRPVVAFDIVLLKEIDSFIYKQQVGEEDSMPSVSSLCELCLFMTTPHKEVRRMLRKSRDNFEDIAIERFFDNKENFSFISEIIKAATRQFEIALSTIIQHGPKEEDGKGAANAPFLTEPSVISEIDQKMALGGS